MTHVRLWASLRAVGWGMRRKPQTYKQAWLFAVLGAVAFLIGTIAAAALINWPQSWPIYAFGSAVVGFLVRGLGSSYGLYRRRQR